MVINYKQLNIRNFLTR